MTPLERDLDAVRNEPGGPIALRLALQLAQVEIEALTGEVEALRDEVATLTVEADTAGMCGCGCSAWCPCGEAVADDCGGWPYGNDGHACGVCGASRSCYDRICEGCGHLDDESAGWRLIARWVLDFPEGGTEERSGGWFVPFVPDDEHAQHQMAFDYIDRACRSVQRAAGAVIGPSSFRFERVELRQGKGADRD